MFEFKSWYDKRRWKVEFSKNRQQCLLTDLEDQTTYLFQYWGVPEILRQVKNTENEFLILANNYDLRHVRLRGGEMEKLFEWRCYEISGPTVTMFSEDLIKLGSKFLYTVSARVSTADTIYKKFGNYVNHSIVIHEEKPVIKIRDIINVTLDAETMQPISKLFSSLRNSVREVSTLEEVIEIYHQDQTDKRKVYQYEQSGFLVYGKMSTKKVRYRDYETRGKEEIYTKLLEKSQLTEYKLELSRCCLCGIFDYGRSEYQITVSKTHFIVRTEDDFDAIETEGELKGITEVEPEVFLCLFEDKTGLFFRRLKITKSTWARSGICISDSLSPTDHGRKVYTKLRIDAESCQMSSDWILTKSKHVYSISSNRLFPEEPNYYGYDYNPHGSECLDIVYVRDRFSDIQRVALLVCFSFWNDAITIIDATTFEIISKVYDCFTERFEDIDTIEDIKSLCEKNKNLEEWAEAEIKAIPPREY